MLENAQLCFWLRCTVFWHNALRSAVFPVNADSVKSCWIVHCNFLSLFYKYDNSRILIYKCFRAQHLLSNFISVLTFRDPWGEAQSTPLFMRIYSDAQNKPSIKLFTAIFKEQEEMKAPRRKPWMKINSSVNRAHSNKIVHHTAWRHGALWRPTTPLVWRMTSSAFVLSGGVHLARTVTDNFIIYMGLGDFSES